MPSSLGLPLPVRDTIRDDFLRRVSRVHGTTYARREATRRLEQRLSTWYGVELASGKSRFKNKVKSGVFADCRVGGDEAEKLIVRALSNTQPDCQFTVTPAGVAYATHNNGWTIKKSRVFVSGLSPLIDDAADILNQMRGKEGGRIFFTRDDMFITARSRLAFLTVVTGDADPEVHQRGTT